MTRRSFHVTAALFVAAALLGSAGCKPSDEAFCKKMRELYGDRMNDCEKDALPEVKAQCGAEAESVMKCMIGASSKDAADACFKPCEKKG